MTDSGTDAVDLDAYFDRIQWGGSCTPTLETLRELLASHVTHIPFENFDVLLGRPVRLDIVALQDKICRNRRGGYCFEHGTLFYTVLRRLGFSTVQHAARITRVQPRSQAHRSHMFSTVYIDGRVFVVDPGLGAYTSSQPIELLESINPKSATHWLTRAGNEWAMNVVWQGKEFRSWMASLEPEITIDFEIANYFTATHPSSRFTQVINASAVTPEGRINIMNQDVSYLFGNSTRKEHLDDRARLRAIVNEHFGFDLPELETMRVPSVPEWN